MISVSYLKSIYSEKETIKKIDESHADLIHVDLMDNTYVPYTNFQMAELLNNLKETSKGLDIHLMVSSPLKYISLFINLNVKIITVHYDINDNLEEVISNVKKNHILMGLAINPDEDIHLLDKYLPLIDYVLVMGVNPGMGGQKFNPEVIEKIKYLQDKKVLIGLDGGVNIEMMPYLNGLKIANLVSGSFVCKNSDFNKSIDELKKYFS